MSRPYAPASGVHLFFGALAMAAGIAWICLLFLYEPLMIDNNGERMSLLTVVPIWITVILAAKIICGFWFFLTGCIGCCIKSRGCTEGVFVALNVLNVIIWAPVLLLTMVGTAVIIFWLPALLSGADFDGEQLQTLFTQYAWLWAFPAVGALIGLIEFILSIVSYSIVCCCRPEALNDGYDYQYEMK